MALPVLGTVANLGKKAGSSVMGAAKAATIDPFTSAFKTTLGPLPSLFKELQSAFNDASKQRDIEAKESNKTNKDIKNNTEKTSKTVESQSEIFKGMHEELKAINKSISGLTEKIQGESIETTLDPKVESKGKGKGAAERLAAGKSEKQGLEGDGEDGKEEGGIGGFLSGLLGSFGKVAKGIAATAATLAVIGGPAGFVKMIRDDQKEYEAKAGALKEPKAPAPRKTINVGGKQVAEGEVVDADRAAGRGREELQAGDKGPRRKGESRKDYEARMKQQYGGPFKAKDDLGARKELFYGDKPKAEPAPTASTPKAEQLQPVPTAQPKKAPDVTKVAAAAKPPTPSAATQPAAATKEVTKAPTSGGAAKMPAGIMQNPDSGKFVAYAHVPNSEGTGTDYISQQFNTLDEAIKWQKESNEKSKKVVDALSKKAQQEMAQMKKGASGGGNKQDQELEKKLQDYKKEYDAIQEKLDKGEDISYEESDRMDELQYKMADVESELNKSAKSGRSTKSTATKSGTVTTTATKSETVTTTGGGVSTAYKMSRPDLEEQKKYAAEKREKRSERRAQLQQIIAENPGMTRIEAVQALKKQEAAASKMEQNALDKSAGGGQQPIIIQNNTNNNSTQNSPNITAASSEKAEVPLN